MALEALFRPGLLAAAMALVGCTGSPDSACDARSPRGRWESMPMEEAPAPVRDRITVWTGREMLVLQQDESGAFDPCVGEWRPVTTDGMPDGLVRAPDQQPTAVVGGRFVFFLYFGAPGNLSPESSQVTGAMLDLDANAWRVLPVGGAAPSVRSGAAIVWAGDRLLVWGGSIARRVSLGEVAETLGDGAAYDPVADRWSPLSTAGAPSPRAAPAAAWTGRKLLVWGGCTDVDNPYTLACTAGGVAMDGAMYDPATDTWEAMRTDDAGPVVFRTPLLWTGSEAILWRATSRSGERFDPVENRWARMAALPPEVRLGDWAAPYLSGDALIVVGTDGAAVYDIAADAWRSVRGTRPDPLFSGERVYVDSDDRSIVLDLPDPEGAPFPGRLARVDELTAAWVLADVPVESRPRSLWRSLWTGDRLISWGGYYEEPDPTGFDGCGTPRPPGCDPVVPTRRVYASEGATLVPAWRPL